MAWPWLASWWPQAGGRGEVKGFGGSAVPG